MSDSRAEATRQAAELDEQLTASVDALLLPRPKDLYRSMCKYLQDRAVEKRLRINLHQLLRLSPGRDRDGVAIELGPPIDKGPTPNHFDFPSGARLSFTVVVREAGPGSRLLGYRFHLRLPPSSPLEFLRFDLTQRVHSDPLEEPRSHLHPGLDHLRLPCPVHSPLALLDRIFFVVEPKFAR